MAKLASVPIVHPPSFGQGGCLDEGAMQGILSSLYEQPVTAASSGAVDPHTQAMYFITKAGIAALTLAAPTPGDDDGTVIAFVSTTAFAHTVTATSLLMTGATGVSIATFANKAGASLRLIAYNGKWYVLAQIQITFS